MATPIPSNEATFSIAELVHATRGRPSLPDGAEDAAVVGVCTDSRALEPGNLFVALVGERFDGHAHARAALERGAAAVLVSRDVEGLSGVAAERGASIVRVEDTLRALGDLAHAHRARWARRRARPGSVVGITGSAGKTTTRVALEGALGALGRAVLASKGNLNNAIGVPMSLFGLGDEHDLGVIEIGMNTPGEIARNTEVAAPDVGIVTLVAAAHTEGVGDVWGVQREKGALLEALPRSGVAIVNGDCARSRATLLRSPAARWITYGASEGCDVRLLERASLGLRGSRLRVRAAPRGAASIDVELETKLLGRAGAHATLAALATVVALDEDARADAEVLRAAAAGIEAGEQGRLAARHTREGGVVIDDAYNANPASMRASIHTAHELAGAGEARLVLVLGAMFELGELSAALHADIGRVAAEAAPAAIVVVGEVARPLAEAARAAGASVVEHVATAAEALPRVRLVARPGDVVLVKGSNSLGLSSVARALLGDPVDAH